MAGFDYAEYQRRKAALAEQDYQAAYQQLGFTPEQVSNALKTLTVNTDAMGKAQGAAAYVADQIEPVQIEAPPITLKGLKDSFVNEWQNVSSKYTDSASRMFNDPTFKPSDDVVAQQAMKIGTGLVGGGALKGLGGIAGKGVDLLKGISAKTPTAVKALTGIGAAATAYETGRGALDADYADRRETFPSQFGASLRSGTGATLENLGYSAEWAGAKGAGESLKQTGKNVAAGFETKPVEFTWKSLLDPDWYANNVASTLPSTAALIPLMVAGYKGAGGIATKFGAGPLVKTIVASLGGTALSRPVESAMEAGSTYQSALESGKSEEVASKQADQVFKDNLKLAGLDAAQLAVAFPGANLGAKMATKLGGKVATGAAKLAFEAGTEGLEEGYQQAAQMQAQGDDKRSKFQQIINPDTQMKESMAMGGILGVGMGGTGVVNDMVTTIKQRTIQSLPDSIMPQVQQQVIELIQQGVEPAEAIDQVLDEVAEVPEVAAQIEQITQEEAAKAVEVLSAQQEQTKAEPTINNEATPAGETVNVVYTKSGKALEVVDQSSPEFYVVQDTNGKRQVVPKDDVTEPVEVIKSVLNPTAKSEPAEAVKTTEQEQAQQGEAGQPNIVAPELQANAAEGQIEGTEAKPGENPVNVAPNVTNEAEIAPNVTSNVTDNIENNIEPTEQPALLTKPVADFTDEELNNVVHVLSIVQSTPEREEILGQVKAEQDRRSAKPAPRAEVSNTLAEDLVKPEEAKPEAPAISREEEAGPLVEVEEETAGESHNEHIKETPEEPAIEQGEEPQNAQSEHIKTAGEFTVTKTKHTKTGEDIWVAQLVDKTKMPREEFAALRSRMKKLGGSWSNFTKGFNFKEDPTAKLQPKTEVKKGDTVYDKDGNELTVVNPGNENTLRVKDSEGNSQVVKHDEVKAEKPAEVKPKFAPGDVVVAQDGVSKYLVTQYEAMDGKLTGMNPRGGTVNLATDHMTKVEGETYTQAEWVGIRTKELEQKIAHINEGDKVKWTDQRKGEELTGRVKHKTEQFGEPALAVNVDQVAFLNGRVPIGRIEYVPASEKTLQKIEEAKPEAKPAEPIKNKDRSPEWVQKMKADAEARIKANKNRMLSGLPMDDMLDYSIIGMCKIIEKGLDLAAFSKEMIDEYGPALKNWMAGIFAQSQAMLDMNEEDLNQMIEDSHKSEKTDIQNTENEVKSGQEQETKEGEQDGEGSSDTGASQADKPDGLRNGKTPGGELPQNVSSDGESGNADTLPEGEVGDVSGNAGTDNGPAKPIKSDTGESEPAGSVSTRPTKQGDSGGTTAGNEVSDTAGPESTNRGNAALNNFQLTQEFIEDLLAGGEKTKAHNNIAAIKLVKQLEAEERLATPDEQTVLAKFVGWGGLAEAFGREHDRWDPELRQYTYKPKYPKWAKEYYELQEILTKEEYDMASRSTQYAHYTAPMVTNQMYNALSRMGFKRGTILEPAMGSGIFFGTIPENIRATKLVGVEIDPISGLISKHLYQKADVKIMGFQDTSLPDDYFDVAISNVPFGDIAVTDNTYKENFKTARLHNYFFVKALDKVRPGGLIAFITSTGTMNANDVTARQLRQYMDQNAEFVGAIRLPGNAFKRIANTEVTTDIIFMRKPFPFETIENKIGWQKVEDTGEFGKYGHAFKNNQYFIEHSEMMLGNIVEDKLHPGRIGLAPKAGEDLETQLQEAISKLPADIFQASKTPIKEPAKRETLENTSQEKQGSFVVEKGKAYQVSGKELIPINGIKVDKIAAFIKLKNSLYAVIDAQQNNETDKAIQGKQKTLGKVYDDFVKVHGYLSDKATKSKFMTDPAYNLLNTLEIKKADGTYAKADIFTKRTIENVKTIDKADNATDGLVISLNQIGTVDMDYIATLTGMSEDSIVNELKGQIFKNPQTGKYEERAEYLSGNVRAKLLNAKAAAELDEAYQENVAALEEVQPIDLNPGQIWVKLGAPWVPESDIRDFIADLLDIGYSKRDLRVSYSAVSGSWVVDSSKLKNERNSMKATKVYGFAGSGNNAFDLIEKSLNYQAKTVSPSSLAGKDETVTDAHRKMAQEMTDAFQEKQRLIEEAFRKWIWQDTDRRERLTAKYNWEKNNTVDWEHDGSHLTFPGKSTNSFSFRRHQKDVIARIIRAGNTLVAHVVGAGKTGVMVGASMELKRLGLAKKNAIVVQKSTIRQITESYYELYPNAKVLAATDKDFSAANRKNFIARIATGDWDAVILSHEQFGMIEMSRKAQEEFIRNQIEELREAKEIAAMEARAQGAKRIATTKDLEKAMQKLEEKLKKLLAKTKKDDAADFEQLGIDQIFVDEAQAYKNLYLYTSLGRVPGIGNSDTGRSSDMLLKTQFLSKLNGGQRGVVFLTGTPVSNSMTELFTMQRYLQPQLLKQMGLNSFDAWAKTFGEISSDVEYNLTGTGFRTKTRFRKFHNLPELIGMFRQVADIKMIEHLPEIQAVRPPHKTTSVAVEPSRQLKEYIDDLIKRAEALVKEKIDPREDNFLKVANDGRLAALDLRLVGMGYDDPHGKINVCVKNVYDTWKKTAKDKTTQAIFSDVGVPTEKKNKGKKKEALEKLNDGSDFLNNNDADTDDALDFLDNVNFDIYNDIKEKLIAKGVPENEIAFIHDAKNDNQRELMFEKVNSGEIRIVLGSTRKMGTGVNIQRLLGKVHHLDVPWLPASIEQRNGRAIRQGNSNKEVEIIHYITQNSFDAYNWQLVENKATFIAQVLLGDKSIREMEDMGESASTASMMKAAASGNPLVGEKVKLDGEIKRLLSLQKHYESEKWTYQHQYDKTLPKKIAELQAMVEKHEKTKASAPSLSGDDFKIKIGNKVFTDKKEANAAFTKEVATHAKEYAKKNKLEKGSAETQVFNIGEIGNLEIRLEMDIRRSTVMTDGQASTVYGYSAAIFAVPKGGTKFDGFGYGIDEADYDSADYVTRLANSLKRVDTAIKESRAMLAQAEKDYKEAEKMVKEPWEHTEKLEKAQARSAELGRMLNEEAEKPEGEATELPDEEETRGPKFKLSDDVAELAEALEDLNIVPAPEAMERDDMQAADIVAKLMSGAPVEPFKGAASPQGVAYGQKIFMNAKTKAPHMYVLKHEVVHELGITDPQALKELMALTKKYALDNKVIQRLVDNHYRIKGYDAEDVWEEFTADVISEVMEQPGFWKQVREKAPTLIKLIVDILDQIITKFSKAVAEEDSMLKYVKDMEAFKNEVAGVMARSLDRRPRNLLDLRQADAFAAKLKTGDNGKMETLYHGRRGEANFKEGRPAFFTSDKEGAEWYAEERGDFSAEPQVSEMNVSVNNPASYDDLMRAVAKTNATKQDIRNNSPYDGINEVDYLYVPKVVKELERQGFDGFKGWDALMNQEIPITVAFSPKQIKPLKGNSNLLAGIGTSKTETKAKLKRSEGPRLTLPDEDVQARMEAARGITPESIKDKLMELKDDLIRKGHRVYEWLPNTGEFRPLKNALLNLRKQKGVAADRTQRYLMEVTKDLNEAEYEVFNYKVIFDDLAHDFEADMMLPFGLSEENFEENKAHIDAEAAKNPKVLEAIEKRKEAWEEVKGEYIKAQQAVGHRVEDKLKKEDYYRHQVLEYANAKSKQQAIKGTGKRLRTPTGRGFLKQREGSTFDINTDYLQAEFEVMAQMLLDAETAKVIKVVKDNHDIIKDLKREAIRLNDEAMIQEFERLLAIMQDTETTPEQLYRKTLNSKQGRAFADLYKLAAKGDLPAGPNEKYQKLIDKMADAYWEAKKNKTDRAELPSEFKGQLFPYLNYLSGNEQTDSEQAKIVARSIFKGRAQKVKYIQKTLGNRYLTWEDLIPEGYAAWQPREGNLFYSAASIPEGLAEQLFFGIADEVGITKEMLSKEMVMGQKYPEIVIKEEVALTLEDLTKQAKQDGPVAKMYHTLYRSWKQFQLISPRRFFKYNIRNVTGDMDAVLAGNPKAMKKIPQAWEDLWQAFFAKDKVMSPELTEWFKRGGFETLMQCQEINDINRNRQFKNIMEGRLKQEFMQKNLAAKSWEIVKSGWNKYWDAARTTTDFREALLRYAVYLEYVEQMAGNKTGQPSNWGASNRDEVMSLKDMRDRAALLTNQLLGAYDEVSVLGTFLADNLLPFWRWNEVNFVRYSRLFKNAYQDGKLMAAMGGKLSGVAIRSPYIAWQFGKFAVKAALLTAIITAWNLLFFDDEEKDLPADVRGRLHIIFGRDKDGKVIYFSRLGALQDFLDWFGVDTPYQTTRDFLNGKKSLKEIATNIVASDANKIINAVTPFIKNTAEALVGVKLYPDAFKPTRIRDRWQYLADSFGLTNEYKALTGKPSRGYAHSLPDLFVYRADPYETAYYGTLDEKYRFMEKIGKGSGTATISPKSESLYNVKAALRYGDKEAFQKYLLEYAARGGTVKGLNQSLNTMNPLYGLNDTEKQVFIQHLDREGKEDCLKAIEYYNKVITGQAGD